MTSLIKVLFGFISSSLKECLSRVPCIRTVNLKISFLPPLKKKKNHSAKIWTTFFLLNFLPILQISLTYSTYLKSCWSAAIQFYGHEDFWSLVLLYQTLQCYSKARPAVSKYLPLTSVEDLDFANLSQHSLRNTSTGPYSVITPVKSLTWRLWCKITFLLSKEDL